MDCRERESHARGVYPTQDTSRMGTAMVKKEEEADTKIIVKEEEVDKNNSKRRVGNIEERNVSY